MSHMQSRSSYVTTTWYNLNEQIEYPDPVDWLEMRLVKGI